MIGLIRGSQGFVSQETFGISGEMIFDCHNWEGEILLASN